MVMMTVGGPWIPNLTIEQSAKSGQIFTAVNSENNMSEVVSATMTIPTQSRKKKGNRGVKDGVPPVVLSSSKQKSRKRKFRKFKKKSKRPQTSDIKPPTAQDAGPSPDNNPLEIMHLDSKQAKAPMPFPPSPTEIRLAALKAMLLEAKGRCTSNHPEQKPLPTSAITKSPTTWSREDLFEDIARKRVASPELSLPAADDQWGVLNYEKRSEKINLESIDLFLWEDSSKLS